MKYLNIYVLKYLHTLILIHYGRRVDLGQDESKNMFGP